jgi:hypothetical protein
MDDVSSQKGPKVAAGASNIIIVTALTLGAWFLYLGTLAPTVLWGDDAEFQRLAGAPGEVIPSRGHVLWVEISRIFESRIDWGETATRANLVSAVFGALTIPLLYLIVLKLTSKRSAAFLAAASFAVSHTFWAHCVRAEVYTLHTFFLAAVLYMLVLWSDAPAKSGWICAAALTAGVGLQNHLLMTAVFPAAIWLMARRAPNKKLVFSLASAFLLIGAAPYLVGLYTAASESRLHGTTFANFAPFAISMKDIVLAAGYHLYQFPAAGVLVVPGLIALWRRDRRLCLFFMVAFFTGIMIALNFQVTDQYVFYLPGYLILAILIGAGVPALLKELKGLRPWAAVSALSVCMIGLPVALYQRVPDFLARHEIELIHVRDVPGRDARFFLWPPKNGYEGARIFSEETFGSMPRHSTILAEWTKAQPLLYMQQIAGRRTDIEIKQLGAGWGRQAPWLLEESRHRQVFIAGTGHRYFDIQEIRELFEVIPAGPVFRLERRFDRDESSRGMVHDPESAAEAGARP